MVVVVEGSGLGLRLGGRESLMTRRLVVVGAMPKVRRDWAIWVEGFNVISIVDYWRGGKRGGVL